MKPWRIRILAAALLLSLIAALATVPAVQAVEFTNDGIVAAGQVVDDDLFIETDEAVIDGTVNGDLFINASTVTVNGVVNGNLMVYSASLRLNGRVTGSLVFAGQSAELSGPVEGTVYAAANTLRLIETAQVTRNLFYAGYALETLPGSSLGRDLYMTGYQADIAGQTERDVSLQVQGIRLSGQIGRNASLNVGAPGQTDLLMEIINESLPPAADIRPVRMLPSGLAVESQAKIGGRLSYASTAEQNGAIQSQPGEGISFTQQVDPNVQPTAREIAAAWLVSRFQEFATLLILGGLAAALLPVWLERSAAEVGQRPHVKAWKGLLALLGGWLAAFMAGLITVIVGVLIRVVSLQDLSNSVFGVGLSSLSMFVGVFLLLIVFGSKLAVAQWGGQALLRRFSPANANHRYWPVIIGICLYTLLRLIPFVSSLVGLAVTLIGLGAIWAALRARQHGDPLPALAPPLA